MVNHINEGCPVGSDCSEKYGQKREKFNQSLKKLSSRKRYFKKHGAPFKYLLPNKYLTKSNDHAIWDSRCFHHRKSADPIIEIEMFTKNSDIDSLPVISKKVFLKKNKKIQTFKLPINADITGIHQNSIHFDIRENLSSYIYKINTKGEFRIGSDLVNQKLKRIKCPKDLLQKYAKESYPTFKSYFCSIFPDGGTILTPVTCI